MSTGVIIALAVVVFVAIVALAAFAGPSVFRRLTNRSYREADKRVSDAVIRDRVLTPSHTLRWEVVSRDRRGETRSLASHILVYYGDLPDPANSLPPSVRIRMGHHELDFIIKIGGRPCVIDQAQIPDDDVYFMQQALLSPGHQHQHELEAPPEDHPEQLPKRKLPMRDFYELYVAETT